MSSPDALHHWAMPVVTNYLYCYHFWMCHWQHFANVVLYCIVKIIEHITSAGFSWLLVI